MSDNGSQHEINFICAVFIAMSVTMYKHSLIYFVFFMMRIMRYQWAPWLTENQALCLHTFSSYFVINLQVNWRFCATVNRVNRQVTWRLGQIIRKKKLRAFLQLFLLRILKKNRMQVWVGMKSKNLSEVDKKIYQ